MRVSQQTCLLSLLPELHEGFLCHHSANCKMYESVSWVDPRFDTPWVCVPSYIPLHMYIVPDIIPQSICVMPRKSLNLLEEEQNCPIVCFAYLCHMTTSGLSFFLVLHDQAFLAWCSSRFLQRIRGWPQQSRSIQIPTPGQLLWAHQWCFQVCADHLLLLLSPLTTCTGPLTVKFYNLTICRASLVATPSGCLPQKRSMKKDTGLKIIRKLRLYIYVG